jgi:hypothetical protein
MPINALGMGVGKNIISFTYFGLVFYFNLVLDFISSVGQVMNRLCICACLEYWNKKYRS